MKRDHDDLSSNWGECSSPSGKRQRSVVDFADGSSASGETEHYPTTSEVNALQEVGPTDEQCANGTQHRCSLCGRLYAISSLVQAGQLAPASTRRLWRCFDCENSRGIASIVASRTDSAGERWLLVRWNGCSDWHASWASEGRLCQLSPAKLRNFDRRDEQSPQAARFDPNLNSVWIGADRDHLLELASYGIVTPTIHRVIAVEQEVEVCTCATCTSN